MISISYDFAQKIAAHSALNFKVHSVFTHAVNLSCDEKNLWTLLAEKADNAPSSLRLPLENFAAFDLEIGDLIGVQNQQLLLGSAVFSLSKARVWQAKLPPFPKAFPPVSNAVLSHIKSLQNALNEAAQKLAQSENDIFASEIRQRSAHLLTALRAKNEQEARKAALSLIGLGQGLTPSGDDILLGLFTVFNTPNNPSFAWQKWMFSLVCEAKTLTNSISFAALQHASNGQVRESIIELLTAILTEKPDHLPEKIQRVLAIGASSGTDITKGILLGLTLCLSEDKKSV